MPRHSSQRKTMPRPNNPNLDFPAISFATDEVPPPAPLYVTPNDRLFLNVVNAVAGADVVIRARLLRADGEIIPYEITRTPSSNRLENGFFFPVAEGFLLSISVEAATVAVAQGLMYVTAGVARSGPSATPYWVTLLSGYVTATWPVSWPGQPPKAPGEGPGFLRSLTGTDPAAGAEISETVPGNTRWRLLSISTTIQVDATVATRQPELVLDDGANIFYRTYMGANIAAGGLQNMVGFEAGYAPTTIITRFHFPIPGGVLLPPGFRIRTITVALQAGDNWAAPQLYMEEWVGPF